MAKIARKQGEWGLDVGFRELLNRQSQIANLLLITNLKLCI